jgi:hypothetical protein
MNQLSSEKVIINAISHFWISVNKERLRTCACRVDDSRLKYVRDGHHVRIVECVHVAYWRLNIRTGELPWDLRKLSPNGRHAVGIR